MDDSGDVNWKGAVGQIEWPSLSPPSIVASRCSLCSTYPDNRGRESEVDAVLGGCTRVGKSDRLLRIGSAGTKPAINKSEGSVSIYSEVIEP